MCRFLSVPVFRRFERKPKGETPVGRVSFETGTPLNCPFWDMSGGSHFNSVGWLSALESGDSPIPSLK